MLALPCDLLYNNSQTTDMNMTTSLFWHNLYQNIKKNVSRKCILHALTNWWLIWTKQIIWFEQKHFFFFLKKAKHDQLLNLKVNGLQIVHHSYELLWECAAKHYFFYFFIKHLMCLFVEELNWFCKTRLKSTDRQDKSHSGLLVRDMASMNVIFAKVGDLVFLKEFTVNQTQIARICQFFSAVEIWFIQEERKVSWVELGLVIHSPQQKNLRVAFALM